MIKKQSTDEPSPLEVNLLFIFLLLGAFFQLIKHGNEYIAGWKYFLIIVQSLGDWLKMLIF